MPACLIVFHHLLHVAETLKLFGPLSTTWSFVMERYLGILAPIVKSRKLPAENLAKTCLMLNRLNHIPFRYESYDLPSLANRSRDNQNDRLLHPKKEVTLTNIQVRHLRQAYAAIHFTNEDQQVKF